MKAILTFALTFLLVLFFFIYMDYYFLTYENNEEPETASYTNEVELTINEEEYNEDQESIEGIHEWIGMESSQVTKAFGEPSRIDMTQYGFDWWVYKDIDKYIQIGVQNDRVNTIYTNDSAVELAHIDIGDTYEEVYQKVEFQENVNLKSNLSTYQYELTESELQMRPLAYVENDIWAQYYFDTVDNALTGVRYLDQETLLKKRPYSLVYRGSLPQEKEWSEDEWAAIQEGQAQQIFDLTNDIRKRHGLSSLEWEESTSIVALGHSRDMFENEYFSHTSPNYGELGDRLNAESITYEQAAENIAAKYVDAIEVVEGWLNSEGHRVNVLNEDLTHIGVGVYRDYYTQNFLIPR